VLPADNRSAFRNETGLSFTAQSVYLTVLNLQFLAELQQSVITHYVWVFTLWRVPEN
jgi:hypothetical protein